MERWPGRLAHTPTVSLSPLPGAGGRGIVGGREGGGTDRGHQAHGSASRMVAPLWWPLA